MFTRSFVNAAEQTLNVAEKTLNAAGQVEKRRDHFFIPSISGDTTFCNDIRTFWISFINILILMSST